MKLAETFIREPGQCPAHRIGTFGRKDTVEYKEEVMVGYRHYDTEETEVLFPFGHGLFYTQFRYSDLTAEADAAETACCRITLKIKNIGKRWGIHELKAFGNIYLKAGEAIDVLSDREGFFLLQYGTGYICSGRRRI